MPVPLGVEARGPLEVPRLGVVAEPERERERRPARARVGLSRLRRGRAAVGGDDRDRDERDGGSGSEHDEKGDATARGHVATIARRSERLVARQATL